MSEMQNKFKEIISDVEKKLKNKEDLEYVKTQIYNIYTIFMDEFDRLEEKSNNKIDNIVMKCRILEDRINSIENSVDRIQNDLYIEEDDDIFNITCPYCNFEFSIDYFDESKNNIICPECNNVIELDWNNYDACSHDCDCCGGNCNDDDDM